MKFKEKFSFLKSKKARIVIIAVLVVVIAGCATAFILSQKAKPAVEIIPTDATVERKDITSITAINKINSGKITSINGSKITIGEKDYTMSDNVQIYLKKSYDYTMLNFEELKEKMSDATATIYQDKPENSGGRVRIIILS